MPGLDYSFSGIKTSFMNFLRRAQQNNAHFVEENLNDLCASLQRHLVDMLMDKLIKAAEQENIHRIAIAGGVSANLGLRAALTEISHQRGWQIFTPRFEYCTDNAAMVAMSAYFQYTKRDFASLSAPTLPRMKIENHLS